MHDNHKKVIHDLLDSCRLIPMLEPDYVAEEVVAGILTNQVLVTLPSSMKYLFSLK